MWGFVKRGSNWGPARRFDYGHGIGDPFAAAVRAARIAMVVTDPGQPDNPIIYCNVSFEEMTGYRREEVIGRNCRFLQGIDTDHVEVAKVRAAINHQTEVSAQLLNYRKDGSSFWNALYLSPVRDSGGTVRFFFASQLDVTERIEAQRIVRDQDAVVVKAIEAKWAAQHERIALLRDVNQQIKDNLAALLSRLRSTVEPGTDRRLVTQLNDILGDVERLDKLIELNP